MLEEKERLLETMRGLLAETQSGSTPTPALKRCPKKKIMHCVLLAAETINISLNGFLWIKTFLMKVGYRFHGMDSQQRKKKQL